MNTRHICTLLALGLASLVTTACMDGDWDEPDLTNPPYGNNTIQEGRIITVKELKTQYSTEIANKGCRQVTDDVQLKVVVTGNDIGGNLYKQVAVADATGGLIVGINGSGLFGTLAVGQTLLINLKDLWVGGYGQQAQIGALYNGSIGRMEPSLWEQHVRLVGQASPTLVDTLDFDPSWDMAEHCGDLVRITGAVIDAADGKAVLAPSDGSVQLSSNCANRSLNGNANLVIRTSTYSDFANMVMPRGKVTVVGVATRYNNMWQIMMRTENDLTTE